MAPDKGYMEWIKAQPWPPLVKVRRWLSSSFFEHFDPAGVFNVCFSSRWRQVERGESTTTVYNILSWAGHDCFPDFFICINFGGEEVQP